MKSDYLHWLTWLVALLVLLSMPVWLQSSAWLSFLAQAAIMMIVCCSFQLLFGQAGLLSFGHAIYFGLAAFICLHSLNRWTAIPIVYLPLIAAIAVAGIACLIGLISCRSTNTVFSMISLALAELLSASALMLPDFFGGEAGISGNRVRDFSWLGWNFASQNQMTGLILVWTVLALLAMLGWQVTPLGRLAHAARDNPVRLGFLGFNTQWVKILSLMSAAFFAGIAGALNALQFELASAENLTVHRSGLILLFTIIGGSQHLLGAVLGALCGVFFTSYLSAWTPAWALYLGLFFVVVVRFLPGGLLAGCQHLLAYFKQVLKLPLHLASVLLCLSAVRALAALLAIVFFVEFLYQRNLQTDPVWVWASYRWDTRLWQSWLWPLSLAVFALFSHYLIQRLTLERWRNREASA